MMFSFEIRPLGQFCLFVCLYLFCGFIRLEMKKIGMMNVRWPDVIHQHI